MLPIQAVVIRGKSYRNCSECITIYRYGSESLNNDWQRDTDCDPESAISPVRWWCQWSGRSVGRGPTRDSHRFTYYQSRRFEARGYAVDDHRFGYDKHHPGGNNPESSFTAPFEPCFGKFVGDICPDSDWTFLAS